MLGPRASVDDDHAQMLKRSLPLTPRKQSVTISHDTPKTEISTDTMDSNTPPQSMRESSDAKKLSKIFNN